MSLRSGYLPIHCDLPDMHPVFCVDKTSGHLYIVPPYKELLKRGRVFVINIEVKDDANFPVIIQRISVTLQIVSENPVEKTQNILPIKTTRKSKILNVQSKLIRTESTQNDQEKQRDSVLKEDTPDFQTRKVHLSLPLICIIISLALIACILIIYIVRHCTRKKSKVTEDDECEENTTGKLHSGKNLLSLLNKAYLYVYYEY